jgi:hypothetical protein
MAAGAKGVETEIVCCADDVKTSFPDAEPDTIKSTIGEGFGGSILGAASV